MAKVWTINVQVNTGYMKNLSGTGTWQAPIGGGQYWRDNVRMSAVSDDVSDTITVGTGDSFGLTVGKDDTIRWVVSEVNPMYLNRVSVVMYGFEQGTNWDASLTPPSADQVEIASMSLLNGFNAESQPAGDKWWSADVADISLPKTTVRSRAVPSTITYHMKFILVDITDITRPKALNYVKIDPTITIKL
jgi:hypothetical protein